MHDKSQSEKFKEQGVDRIVLLGNPNVGKSVIFSLLTDKYVTVSNYPGTTVELTHGTATYNNKKHMIIDTPGINSLIPMSEDEGVTRDILLNEKIRGVVQVIDAKNLSRGLFLTLQLTEMGIPFLLNLNMEDEAKSRGISIKSKRIEEIFGVDVVQTIATQRKGINELINNISTPSISKFKTKYDSDIEDGIQKLEKLIPESKISKRSIAIMLLGGDERLKKWFNKTLKADGIDEIENIKKELQKKYSKPLGYVINQQRMKQVDSILDQTMDTIKIERNSFSEKLGNASMHPLWGIPILAIILYVMYKFVGYFGAQVVVGYFEETLFGEYLNPLAIEAFSVIPYEIVRDLFVGDYGLITMALTYAIALILPIVGTFFIAFGILEDSGYLPRLAIMLNKVFNKMGLNGKAVLPMILGLGCDTMATLTTRILETKKERIIVTLLLALAVPCSAQLGVILGILSSVSFKATAIWAGVILFVIFLVGYLSSKLIPGKGSDFILEVPPIRVPQAKNIFVKTLARIEWYLREAVPLFILGTLMLFILDKLGALVVIEQFASPVVVGLLGLPIKATEAFLIGFFRRDYGAAGLFALAEAGQLDSTQIIVSLVTITLFVPCIANFFIMVKERGIKIAVAMAVFIFPFAFLVGGVLNFILRSLEVVL
tara:strand:+ start:1470 stop:3443 length:1974 start_codon:yes stop_codon:yes gene_type:complete